ncbi:hypothetical protein [Micromonospora luteifusca]|uniref:hypothetical protein n=1 Tax=Micromonospora luteifusca TaxID=709860 RepID=UPI003F4C186F
MVLILESRTHLDLGDLPNLLAAELGVMTVRLERAIRSLDGVARVHVNRWGDGSAHLHMWFLARPYGRLQLRGTFLSLWDSILPPISEAQWRENLALVAAWLAEFGGRPLAEPPRIQWQAPSSLLAQSAAADAAAAAAAAVAEAAVAEAVSVIEAANEIPEPAPEPTPGAEQAGGAEQTGGDVASSADPVHPDADADADPDADATAAVNDPPGGSTQPASAANVATDAPTTSVPTTSASAAQAFGTDAPVEPTGGPAIPRQRSGDTDDEAATDAANGATNQAATPGGNRDGGTRDGGTPDSGTSDSGTSGVAPAATPHTNGTTR